MWYKIWWDTANVRIIAYYFILKRLWPGTAIEFMLAVQGTLVHQLHLGCCGVVVVTYLVPVLNAGWACI